MRTRSRRASTRTRCALASRANPTRILRDQMSCSARGRAGEQQGVHERRLTELQEAHAALREETRRGGDRRTPSRPGRRRPREPTMIRREHGRLLNEHHDPSASWWKSGSGRRLAAVWSNLRPRTSCGAPTSGWWRFTVLDAAYADTTTHWPASAPSTSRCAPSTSASPASSVSGASARRVASSWRSSSSSRWSCASGSSDAVRRRLDGPQPARRRPMTYTPRPGPSSSAARSVKPLRA